MLRNAKVATPAAPIARAPIAAIPEAARRLTGRIVLVPGLDEISFWLLVPLALPAPHRRRQDQDQEPALPQALHRPALVFPLLGAS
jgi:hypothetical protein